MEWVCKKFEQLDVNELYELLKLRVDVFVVEQTCPYPELDNKDRQSGVYHLMGYVDGKLSACSRLLPAGVSFETISIGRVAIDEQARGAGAGHELMQQSISYCEQLWGQNTITIGAQSHLKQYYQKHGFEQISEEYLEDDIPHIDMQRLA